MTRLGYVVLVLLILALGFYVLRPPPPTVDELAKVWEGEKPTRYEVHVGGRVQRVDGMKVAVEGITLPLGEERAEGLWNQLAMLSSAKDQVEEGVTPADYQTYGIDPERSGISGNGIELAWGEKDGVSRVVNALNRRVYVVERGLAPHLDALAVRLDAESPIPLNAMPLAIEADGVRADQRAGVWLPMLDPFRLSCTARAMTLLRLLHGIRVTDPRPTTVAIDGVELGRVRIEYPNTVTDTGHAPIYSLVLRDDGQGGAWLSTNDWPVQRMTSEGRSAWVQAIADFRQDRLFDISGAQIGTGVEQVLVFRDDKPWFSLESSAGKALDDLSSRWDVVWSGGREYAAPDCAERVIMALNGLTVAQVRPRLGVDPPWPDAVVVMLSGKMIHEPIFLELRHGEARSAIHHGVVIALPDLLRDLRPDRFLDPVIAARAPERVVKIQRRLLDRDPPQEEVFTCDEAGTWRRSWPTAGPVDQVSLQRIARALAAGTAREVRLATEADRAVAGAPVVEIAARYAPKPEGKANDFTDLEETTTTDLGLAMAPQGDAWTAVAMGTGIAYTLDPEFVTLLSQDADSSLVVPLVPALVSRLDLAGQAGSESMSLRRSGDGWLVDPGGRPAREVEVRRLLRDLATLTARRRIEGGALLGSEAAGTVGIMLPGAERDLSEQILLQIGPPGGLGAGADEVVVYAESTRLGALVRSRAVVGVADVAGFARDSSRFLAP